MCVLALRNVAFRLVKKTRTKYLAKFDNRKWMFFIAPQVVIIHLILLMVMYMSFSVILIVVLSIYKR